MYFIYYKMYNNCGENMITGIQIRAARASLMWSASKLADLIGVTRLTIQRLEKFDDIPPSRSQTLAELQEVFENAGIEFLPGNEKEGPGVRFNQLMSSSKERIRQL